MSFRILVHCLDFFLFLDFEDDLYIYFQSDQCLSSTKWNGHIHQSNLQFLSHYLLFFSLTCLLRQYLHGSNRWFSVSNLPISMRLRAYIACLRYNCFEQSQYTLITPAKKNIISKSIISLNAWLNFGLTNSVLGRVSNLF